MLGRLRRRVIRRRAFALVLLAAIMGFTVEPVVGVVRDGDVHHETAAEAAAHSGLASADHAHEQTDSRSSEHTDGSHEHGSSADHCSHAHGPALLGAFAFEIATTQKLFSFDEPVRIRMSTPTALTHPPRA